MTAPEPGWYADPAAADPTSDPAADPVPDAAPQAAADPVYRWWDGAGWTDWLSRDQHAPAPETPPAEPAAAATFGSTPGTSTPGTETPGRNYPPGYERNPPPSALGTTPAATGPASPEPVRRGLHGARLLGLIAVLVAVVVVVAIVIYGNRSPTSPLSLPDDSPSSTPGPTAASTAASTAGSTTAAVTVALDAKTGKVSVGTFSANLPAKPYSFDDSVFAYPPMLDSGVLAQAPVNVNYDGEHTWFAGMAVGTLDPATIKQDDAKATAEAVWRAYYSINFPNTKTTVGTITTASIKSPGADRAATATGHVNYQVTNVASRYDQESVFVAQLADGTWVGWMSSRPEKASAQVKTALEASIKSISTS